MSEMYLTFDNFDKRQLRLKKNNTLYYGKRRRSETDNKGFCRVVYIIDDVVIKFDDKRVNYFETDPLYHQTPSECRKYKKIQNKDKKYFPRTKAIRACGRFIEIQERIDGQRPETAQQRKKINRTINRLIKRYRLTDIRENDSNFLITKKEQPVIVDFAV